LISEEGKVLLLAQREGEGGRRGRVKGGVWPGWRQNLYSLEVSKARESGIGGIPLLLLGTTWKGLFFFAKLNLTMAVGHVLCSAIDQSMPNELSLSARFEFFFPSSLLG
jgi:hypothetical protein